ncbi:MAG: 50S ribosomal protein L29 [Patescibacteria group bacterium]|nr:50S ribosomal protein L29 [Patescibacteria group bacterium]
MKKVVKEWQKKSIKEIENEINKIREEIAKLRIEMKVNPPKDTNILIKKRKNLAVALTILTQKKEEETLKKELKIKKE